MYRRNADFHFTISKMLYHSFGSSLCFERHIEPRFDHVMPIRFYLSSPLLLKQFILKYILNKIPTTICKLGRDLRMIVKNRSNWKTCPPWLHLSGGGEVHVDVPAVKSISPIDLTSRGQIEKFTCRSFVAGVLPARIAQEMADAAEKGEIVKW